LRATADDEAPADAVQILDFSQAQARALKTDEAGPARKGGRITVQQAVDDYIAYLRAHKKTADDTAGRLAKHILPRIGARPIVELTKAEIERCQRAMVRRDPDDPEVERRSKDTSNRVLTMLKAALTRAFDDEDNGISTDAAWRRVKPFRDVGRAREVHLDTAQATRLINSTTGAFRWLVTAALLTGARPPHELATLRVRDFHADLGTLRVRDGKTGPRDIVLTKEGIRFFREISAGRAPDALLLPKDDGTAWGRGHHTRHMIEAVQRAKLSKDCTVYSLRHTYASQGLLNGMNFKVLAENMGTSIRMIEVHYGKFIAATRAKLVEESAFKLGLKPGKVTPIDRASR
jgi:integrase